MEITEVNKKIVQRFYELVEQENYAEAKKLCHKDFVFYFQMDTPIYGADGFVESERKNFSAFGHFTMKIHNLLAEGNKVAAYLIFESQHNKAPLMGVSPSGKNIRFSLFMLLTLKDGLIIEKRAHFDRTDILAQASGVKG